MVDPPAPDRRPTRPQDSEVPVNHDTVDKTLVEDLYRALEHIPGSGGAFLSAGLPPAAGESSEAKLRFAIKVLLHLRDDLGRMFRTCEEQERRLRDIDSTMAGLRRLFGELSEQ